MSRDNIFYGWFIVFVSLLAVSASGAPFVVASMGLFFIPFHEEFGWSRTQLSTLLSIFILTIMVSQPIAGRFIDRLGTRTVLIPSTIAFGLGLTAVPLLVSELWHLGLVFFFIGTAGVAANTMPYLRVISVWFNKRRGLAIGISISGIGLGYAYVPVLVQTMINNHGWRSGYYALGAIVLFIIVPLISLVLKESPAELGLSPDGATQSTADNVVLEYGMSSSAAIRKREFWLLSLVFLFIAFILHGILLHLVPLLRDKGIDATTTSYMAAVMGATVFVSRILIGWLIDIYFAPKVALVFFGLSAMGFLVLLLSSNMLLMYLAAMMIGLSLGAEVDLLAYLCGRYFGLNSFAEIFGLLFVSVLLGSVLGSITFGYGFDSMNTYSGVLIFCVVLNIVALLLITRLGPYPDFKDSPPHNSVK